MSDKKIDADFIKYWMPFYDKPDIGADYSEYTSIMNKVHRDVANGTIYESTFKDILDWKAARIKGKVDWNNFEYYDNTFKEMLKAEDDAKLSILCQLDGIGVPTASTILHFIYPERFPIIDYRVMEVLNNFGYLNTKNATSESNYHKYRNVILNIAAESNCSLSELDRALFAYHKENLD
ncbi:conserved hypothetical protein [Methanohalobium evestigatum Z-7303]|uniref:HhH-GPD family protein n=1 Tax=Methanohalobium evestigatum (strain ATCC BAA-1072 / DSM 3721 / NBRC 107634 / OCM 161 / Z-7303) TaxID=644295 RepID=D7E829_METEZ|nr:hypothetical protein [Methanohalobium evestigatum]ADI73371.1 conserved hypothetical protein [Methanohalobium evestigatum Z-7303]